jgi:hypothetical protein
MKNPFKRSPIPQNSIAENLQTQFNHLENKIQLPPELKNAVFNTVQSVNLTSDVLDLFTTTFLHTGAVFIELLRTGVEDEV